MNTLCGSDPHPQPAESPTGGTAGQSRRFCQRPACTNEAVVTVTIDDTAQLAAVGPLRPRRAGAGMDLCAIHRDRFSPPTGWEVLWYDPEATGQPE